MSCLQKNGGPPMSCLQKNAVHPDVDQIVICDSIPVLDSSHDWSPVKCITDQMERSNSERLEQHTQQMDLLQKIQQAIETKSKPRLSVHSSNVPAKPRLSVHSNVPKLLSGIIRCNSAHALELEQKQTAARATQRSTMTSARGMERHTISKALDLGANDLKRRQAALGIASKAEEEEYEDVELAEQLATVQTSWRRRLLRVVASSPFELFFALMIVTNAVFIGVQVDDTARNPYKEPHFVFYVVQQLYAFTFLVELFLRLLAEGYYFFCNRSWYWNYLDTFLVAASIFEVVTEIMATQGGTEESKGASSGAQGVANLRMLRVVRIARLMRILRVLRVVRFIRGLRTLLFSIIHTLKSLVWAMLLLLIIIYVFAILFTQFVGDYMADNSDGDDRLLRLYWSNLLSSMFTLFGTVSGGLSWDDPVRPLSVVNWFCVPLFTVYITFVYFAVLNVVTGVFCHAAIESAQHDQDIVIQQQLANKRTYVQKVKNLFSEFDMGKNGTINLAVFEEHFSDEAVQAYFSSLDLDPSDAWTLFKLLDDSESHEVNAEQFALGCLRLRGTAKRIDIEKVLYDNHQMLKGLAQFSEFVETQLARIAGQCESYESTPLCEPEIDGFDACEDPSFAGDKEPVIV